jgi:hypothetical protein
MFNLFSATRRSREIFIAEKHFFRVQLGMSLGTLQRAGNDASSGPGLLAEVRDQPIAATDLTQIIPVASIDLVAFCKETQLASVRVEQPIRDPQPYIVACPIPVNVEIRHLVTLSNGHLSAGGLVEQRIANHALLAKALRNEVQTI